MAEQRADLPDDPAAVVAGFIARDTARRRRNVPRVVLIWLVPLFVLALWAPYIAWRNLRSALVGLAILAILRLAFARRAGDFQPRWPIKELTEYVRFCDDPRLVWPMLAEQERLPAGLVAHRMWRLIRGVTAEQWALATDADIHRLSAALARAGGLADGTRSTNVGPDADLAEAILVALEAHRETRALPTVKRLAGTPLTPLHAGRIEAAATRCLAALEARQEAERHAARLLRASEQQDDTDTALLRPASTAADEPEDVLLRRSRE